MLLANLVPAGAKPSTGHSDVLLELAYLATADDGRLDDASEDEKDLQIILAEALGLDGARVVELTAGVYASLDSGEDP